MKISNTLKPLTLLLFFFSIGTTIQAAGQEQVCQIIFNQPLEMFVKPAYLDDWELLCIAIIVLFALGSIAIFALPAIGLALLSTNSLIGQFFGIAILVYFAHEYLFVPFRRWFKKRKKKAQKVAYSLSY